MNIDAVDVLIVTTLLTGECLGHMWYCPQHAGFTREALQS